MPRWPNTSLIDALGIELPILQAPMAGASGSALAIEVCRAGGLGALPCATLNAEQIRAEFALIRDQTSAPINLNFFCHESALPDQDRAQRWISTLSNFYAELGIPLSDVPEPGNLNPFDAQMCELVEELQPEIVSFHFGLPEAALVARVKAAGCKVFSSATTVREAYWLEANGCDAIIAQGADAGGHRGMFLSQDISTQVGTFSLVPQVVDAVSVPVIAAGGIGDGRGIAAAFCLGAAAVQIGTAFLFSPQSHISELHRKRLNEATDDETALTNVFSGRPARSLLNRVVRDIGPMTSAAPDFPGAGSALAPLKKTAEAMGRDDFSSLWCGQSASLCTSMPAGELVGKLAADALLLVAI
jgi:nitronate monooxygenase